MNSTNLHSTLRELQRLVALPRLWIVFGVVVALFAATGPFGTYNSLDNVTRVGYWLLVHGLAWSFALFFIILTSKMLEQFISAALPRMLMGAAIAAIPIALVVNTINWAVLNQTFSLQNLAESMLNAVAVSLPLCMIVWMALDGRQDRQNGTEDLLAPDAVPDKTERARPRLLDRLPLEKRGPLIRLEVQDHYVLVVTSKGTGMLLLRLADAISETEPLDGRQVHRSHWVARNEDNQLIRGGGSNAKLMIRTIDGSDIPVSRTFAADTKAWLG